MDAIAVKQRKTPLFLGRENHEIIGLRFNTDYMEQAIPVSVEMHFSKDSNPEIIDSLRLFFVKDDSIGQNERICIAESSGPFRKLMINYPFVLNKLDVYLLLDIKLKPDALLEKSFAFTAIDLVMPDSKRIKLENLSAFRYRPTLILRDAGQDNCHTYRIPGLATTNAGSLIAVYDVRYRNSKDLQEDIDVGMCRSTDGGQSWEPMKVIMDMGEWGGRPQNQNGVGDPAVLYDPFTNTLWVAALWMSGSKPDKAIWWDSQPGMMPDETGQIILVKSVDDGLSWSEPINITPQIKDPSWQLLLAGPGKGITLDNGTLVFAAQFKADIGIVAIDGGKYSCHSTIVYSSDGGKSWQIGSGAKPNTTEAQLVQLSDGSLMLNMRDDLNRQNKGHDNGRAVAISRDLGQSWKTHPSSNHALIEPNCMASLISVDNDANKLLFFSNPAHHSERKNLSIKVSFDEGNTWPNKNQILLNEETGYGYSCLTQTADGCIGIVYEGEGALYFQKIPISAFISEN